MLIWTWVLRLKTKGCLKPLNWLREDLAHVRLGKVQASKLQQTLQYFYTEIGEIKK